MNSIYTTSVLKITKTDGCLPRFPNDENSAANAIVILRSHSTV